MSVFSDLVGSAAGGVAGANPISVIGGLADDVFNAVFPSPEAKASAEATAIKTQMDAYVAKATVDMAPLLAQLDINKTEAANPSWLVAGWRPAIGWVGVVGLALYYWPTFVIGEFFWVKACLDAHAFVVHPDMGITDLLGLLGSMLGIGGLRTLEKIQGVDTKAVGKAKT